MDKKKIERINMLAKKSKTEGLSVEEKIEQQVLRQEYLSDFRKNLSATLDQVVFLDPDGSKRRVQKKNPYKQ